MNWTKLFKDIKNETKLEMLKKIDKFDNYLKRSILDDTLDKDNDNDL